MEKITNTEKPTYSSTAHSLSPNTGDKEADAIIAGTVAQQEAEQSAEQGWTEDQLNRAEEWCRSRGWTVNMQVGGRSGLVLETDVTGDAYHQALVELANHIGAWYVIAGGVRRIVADPRHAMSANSLTVYVDGEMHALEGRYNPLNGRFQNEICSWGYYLQPTDGITEYIEGSCGYGISPECPKRVKDGYLIVARDEDDNFSIISINEKKIVAKL